MEIDGTVGPIQIGWVVSNAISEVLERKATEVLKFLGFRRKWMPNGRQSIEICYVSMKIVKKNAKRCKKDMEKDGPVGPVHIGGVISIAAPFWLPRERTPKY